MQTEIGFVITQVNMIDMFGKRFVPRNGLTGIEFPLKDANMLFQTRGMIEWIAL
jgi:hypothetical protein